MEANNLVDSSNRIAEDVGLGPDVSEMTNFINPRMTFDHPSSILPIQTCSPLSQTSSNHFLRVPEINIPRKRPLSPSPKALLEQNTVNDTKSPGSLLSKNIKSKPLASAKKAEEVSNALASEIAKCMALHRGSPGDIQATIKDRLLLTFNPELSRKRSAQKAFLEDDLNQGKKRRVRCDQCPATTARECDMR